MDSLQPWNHCGQFGHATLEHAAILAIAAMDSLQPWNRSGHFGHFGYGFAIANLAMK